MIIEPYRGPPIIPPGQTITLTLTNGVKVTASAMLWTLGILQILDPEQLRQVIACVEQMQATRNETASFGGPNGAAVPY